MMERSKLRSSAGGRWLALPLSALSLFLLCSPQGAAGYAMGDAYDVGVRLYKDQNCFEQAEELVLTTDNCYANVYSNRSKAFQITIVSFSEPQRMNLVFFEDHCWTPVMAPTAVRAGECQHFTGGFYGIYSLKYRSANECTAGASCSYLRLAVQEFYQSRICYDSGLCECIGDPYESYAYPIQKECLRWSNGTQIFETDAGGVNLTQTDYPGDDSCQGKVTRPLIMRNGYCYPLYSNRGFKWTLTKVAAVSGAARQRGGGLLQRWTFCSPLVLAVLLGVFLPLHASQS